MKTREDLVAEFESATKVAEEKQAIYRNAPWSEAHSDAWRAKADAAWMAQKKATNIRRKILRLDKIERAKQPVAFITWKRYGFRHIVLHEDRRPHEYHGEAYTILDGMAFCGNNYAASFGGGEKVWYIPNDEADLRATGRPLCGACKKQWKSLTGEVLT